MNLLQIDQHKTIPKNGLTTQNQNYGVLCMNHLSPFNLEALFNLKTQIQQSNTSNIFRL